MLLEVLLQLFEAGNDWKQLHIGKLHVVLACGVDTLISLSRIRLTKGGLLSNPAFSQASFLQQLC